MSMGGMSLLYSASELSISGRLTQHAGELCAREQGEKRAISFRASTGKRMPSAPCASASYSDLSLFRSRSCCSTPRKEAFVTRAGLFDFLVKNVDKTKQRQELKEKLLELIAPLERGAEASEEQQEAVDEAASALEKVNPNKSSLSCPLLNGKWKLVYTTSDGILKSKLPKLLRPSGPIFQCIDTTTLKAQNIETFPYFNQVQATLTPTSASAVAVKFDKFKIGGLIPVTAPENARGELDITYVDDELRISRGNKGNLFVLTMEDPDYRIKA